MTEKTDKGASEKTRAFDLKFGYEDKETPDVKHRAVVFGRRSTGADFIRSVENSNDSEVQFGIEMMASAVTQFGTLEMPVPLTVLLSLNRIDREKLQSEYFLFLGETSVGDAKKDDVTGRIVLVTGVERDGKNYKELEFGTMISGYDEIEIEKQTSGSEEQTAMRIGKEIAKIYDTDGNAVDGGLSLDEMKSLDIDDFTFLREAEAQWLNSFR